MASKNKKDDHDDPNKPGNQDDNHDHNGHDGKKEYAAKMPNRKYAYFRDNQITFLVTHKEDQISGKQLKAFTKGVNDALKQLDPKVVKKIPRAISSQAISFPNFTKKEMAEAKGQLSNGRRNEVAKAFSIVKCDLRNTPDDPAGLLTIVKELKQQSLKEPIAGLTIQGTSLNWLTSVASQAGGTGGPGGRPFPYFGNPKTAPYHFDITKQLKEAKGGNIYGDGSDVDVVILDTAPCAHDLVAAFKECPDHPLISTLLGPNGKLHLYPATYNELLRLGCTSLNDHDYKMTDHGLFIAGIIHSIVPQAEIHLIEVLNQYGVGDLTSFVQGLLTVWTEIYKPDCKIVINCSWMLDFPLADNHCRHMDQVGDPDAVFERQVREFAENDQATPLLLNLLFDRFYVLGKQALAASGNDARTGDSDRTPARYPAALKSVKGVGALPVTLDKLPSGKYQPTVYSNFSESPDKRGVVIRGIVTLGGEQGEGKGILGLYIGEFPCCCRNESRWAWWCGTSFATPVLTGAVASILSRKGNKITKTQDAIKKLYAPGVKIIKEGKAGKQEDALPVTQS